MVTRPFHGTKVRRKISRPSSGAIRRQPIFLSASKLKNTAIEARLMSQAALRVELKALRDRAGEVTKFLRSRIDYTMTSKGTRLQIEGAKAKEIKLLLHKFLHHQGLNDYRIVNHDGILEITPVEKRETHETRRSGSPPTAPQTTPYLFPQASALVPKKTKRAGR